MNKSSFDLSDIQELSRAVASWLDVAKDCEVVAFERSGAVVSLYWLKAETPASSPERLDFPSNATRLALPGTHIGFSQSGCIISATPPEDDAVSAAGPEVAAKFSHPLPCPPTPNAYKLNSLVVYGAGAEPDSNDVAIMSSGLLVLKTHRSGGSQYAREYLSRIDISDQNRKFRRNVGNEGPLVYQAIALYVPAHHARVEHMGAFPAYVLGVLFDTQTSSETTLTPITQVKWVT